MNDFFFPMSGWDGRGFFFFSFHFLYIMEGQFGPTASKYFQIYATIFYIDEGTLYPFIQNHDVYVIINMEAVLSILLRRYLILPQVDSTRKHRENVYITKSVL